MGIIIQYWKLQLENPIGLMKPIIYCNEKYCEGLQQIVLNEKLAALLIKIKPERKIYKDWTVFFKKFWMLLQKTVVFETFDVLFNPAYKIDVLQLLIVANRSKSFFCFMAGNRDRRKIGLCGRWICGL